MAGRSKCGFRYALLVTVCAAALTAAEPSAAEMPRVVGWWVEGQFDYNWTSNTRYPLVNQSLNGGFLFAGSSIRQRTAYGWSAAFGIRTDTPWDMRMAYSGLRSNLRRKADDFNGSVSGPWQSVPFGSAFNTQITTGRLRAKLRSRYDIGDFEVGYNVGLGGGTVRLFGGLRVASFTANMNALLVATSSGYGTNVTFDARKYRFLGAGPRVGVSGDLPIASMGPFSFGVVGGAAFAALFGTTKAETSTTLCTEFNGCATRPFNEDSSKFAYSIDGNLGASLGFDIFGVPSSLIAGYQVEYFHGVVNTTTGPKSLSAGAGGTNGYWLSHGPFVRLKIRF